jgi:hypothetical protein
VSLRERRRQGRKQGSICTCVTIDLPTRLVNRERVSPRINTGGGHIPTVRAGDPIDHRDSGRTGWKPLPYTANQRASQCVESTGVGERPEPFLSAWRRPEYMTTFDAGGVTLKRLRENVWEIPQSEGMRVPARVLASERLLAEIGQDKASRSCETPLTYLGSKITPSRCPTPTKGTAFPSAVSPGSTPRPAVSVRER